MPTTLTNGTTTRTCLNGYWDFRPVHEFPAARTVPADGWIPDRYVVPSMWNKSREGIRQPGETVFRVPREGEVTDERTEFYWDSFSYPVEWDKTHTAWARRTLILPALKPGRRYFLNFEGILRRSTLFVNGREIVQHFEGTLPLEADVTAFLHPGDNEIAVLMEDYTRAPRDRTVEPSGNMFTLTYCGIWQDVWLIDRADVYVSDVTIRTSTRKKQIEVILEITNSSDLPRDMEIALSVVPWKRRQKPEKGQSVLSPGGSATQIQPASTHTYTVTTPWANAEYWQPERPALYWLKMELSEGGKVCERVFERFGFREIWIEGPHVMLNGFPIHMFSDWCHKLTPYHLTEVWIRKWYAMMKEANMNHTRLHAFPHSTLHLEIADEEGILVTDETSLYGSSGRNACELPEYWQRSRDHVRRLIKRDKNRPCVVLWSVENEFRWANEGPNTRYTPVELPYLKKLFNELDPTRPAYHEGDSSLWNEREQDIVSRHYGKDCSGLGWWDRTQPLHSGELSFYHYLGPNNSVQNVGDASWADYAETDRAAGLDTAFTVEEGRTLGVCNFGPWNLSGMSNLRNQPQRVELTYDDLTTPGIKPRIIQPYAAEFTFWEKGRGYVPAPSFALFKQAFRPLAVVDRSHGHNYFAGTTVDRELFVVNDSAVAVSGTVTVSLERGGSVVFTQQQSLAVARGHVGSVRVRITTPTAPGRYQFVVRFESEQGRDQWKRPWRIDEATCRLPTHMPLPGTVAVFGKGQAADYLGDLGIEARIVPDLTAASLQRIRVLVVDKHSILSGTTHNQDLKTFVQRGGRVILLEQHSSPFAGALIEELPVLSAFIRAPKHPVMRGFDDEDFAYWGEDPYALIDNDSSVALRLYRKDDGRQMLPLLDAGEGAFGTGDLVRTPLFECQDGIGLILGCQLRVLDKKEVPAAGRLFARLLDRAIGYRLVRPRPPLLIAGEDSGQIEAAMAKAHVGGTVVVNNIPPAALSAWSAALGVSLEAMDAGPVFQAIRAVDDSVLAGISQEDLSGIQNWVYYQGTCVSVCATALKPVEGVEALLVTPTRSCLRELFHEEGKSETLRIPFVSRALFGGLPGPALVMGRVAVGRGVVIINQFAPAPGALPRLDRATARLLANLGVVGEGSLLDGDRVPEPTGKGPGYPCMMQLSNDNCDAAQRATWISHTVPNPERFDSMPILQCGTWRRLQVDDGIVRADGLDLGREIHLYYSAVSPTQRRQPSMDLGIPNPESYTFIDFLGAGRVELVVNGEERGQAELVDGQATLSDIPLEKGVNRVLVTWTPRTQHDTLQMKWRNILRQPERQLQFWGWM